MKIDEFKSRFADIDENNNPDGKDILVVELINRNGINKIKNRALI